MDALLLLWVLEGQPVRIDTQAAWFAGPAAPIVLPVAVLPSDRRAARLLAESRLPLGERVRAAFAWDESQAALRVATSHSLAMDADPDLRYALATWAASECRRLGLPTNGSLVAIDATGLPRQSSPNEVGALADVHDLLATLAWPRWCGPLVLVPYGVDHPVIAAGRARIARPALPVLRPPHDGDERATLAAAIADLALALSAPPANGWPSWLTTGVAGCAHARGSFVGIPEHAMAVRRAAAGTAAIAAMMSSSSPADPALATAVCAALLHPSRRARFPDLLELLRHGASGSGAIATAYGLRVETLAAPP